MKKKLLLLCAVITTIHLSAQNFSGQWKGQYTDKSSSFVGWGGDHCEYVLEIECDKEKVTGYSYTYFNDGGKRFYTICKLSGTINKAKKYIEVTEFERTKTNVPNNIRNCFQTHHLTYYERGDEQTLEGNWTTASKQEGDCGYGSTVLTRRALQNNITFAKNTTAKNKSNNKTNIPTKNNPKNIIKENSTALIIENNNPKQTPSPLPAYKNFNPGNNKLPGQIITQNDFGVERSKKNQIPTIDNKNFEKRNNNLLKTIEIENETFRVDLYDNGDVDGDSISLFFNGKLILAHKRLSEKAISITLNVDEERDVNELIMYADNLGSIPPNTALMVVTDGDKRYETRISSDMQKSGTIRFVYTPKD